MTTPKDDKPKIYLSNWASARSKGHHGRGRAYSIMAKPRPWEHGEGSCEMLTPTLDDFELFRECTLTLEAYRERFETAVAGHPIGPAELLAVLDFGIKGTCSRPVVLVRDGDTLCCSCSRESAAKGECHRAWIAELLHHAGWRVILDGKEWPSDDGVLTW